MKKKYLSIAVTVAAISVLSACASTEDNADAADTTTVQTTQATTEETETTTEETTSRVTTTRATTTETTTGYRETTTEEADDSVYSSGKSYGSVTIGDITFSDISSISNTSEGSTHNYLTFKFKNSSDSTTSMFMDDFYVVLPDGEYYNFSDMYDYEWVLKHLHHDLSVRDLRPEQEKHGALHISSNPISGSSLYYKDQLIRKF